MLDRVISAVAVAQAIYVTLQAGIKLVEQHVVVTPPPFEMEGPRILPGETDDGLFALTEAFRCAVRLGLRSGPYRDTDSFEVMTVDGERSRRIKAQEPYRLSLTSCYHHHGSSPLSLASSVVKSRDQGQQLNRPMKQMIEYTTLQNGDIIPKSSLDAMDLASLADDVFDDDNNGSVGLPLSHVASSSSSSSSSSHIHIDNDNDDNHYHDDFDVVRTATVPAGYARIGAYAPEAFAALRQSFGVDERLYHNVLLQSGPFVSFTANSKGSARSGGVFFFTANGAFLIKSVKPAEATVLLDTLLPRYARYMMMSNASSSSNSSPPHDHHHPNGRSSLLNRICGLYRVEMMPQPSNSQKDGNKNKTQVYNFVVMNSVFPAHVRMDERYDLKGSTRGRRSSLSESVRKDLDLIAPLSPPLLSNTRSNNIDDTANDNDDAVDDNDESLRRHGGGGLMVGARAKRDLLEQLRRDVDLLRSCSLIDYRYVCCL
jgi:hypothetical protein